MRVCWMLSLTLFFITLLLEPICAFVAADEPRAKSSAGVRALPAFTEERETVALKFVEQHHPELGKVLVGLKSTNEGEYKQAIREVFRTTEILAGSQDEKYSQLLLEAWKANSRAELLAARMAYETDADVRAKLQKELKEQITRHVDLQREMLQNRRQAVLVTLEQMDANIKKLEESRERMVESRFQILSRVPKKPARTLQAPPEKKPAEKKAEPAASKPNR